MQGDMLLSSAYNNIEGCCDNDVHEHFKAMAEVALDKAYVIVCQGYTECWNCTVEWKGNTVHVTPSE